MGKLFYRIPYCHSKQFYCGRMYSLGSEFHTRNARFRQPQEQRRAKAQR